MGIIKAIYVSNSSISKEGLIKITDIQREDLKTKLDELIGMKILDKRVADWGYSYSISDIRLEKTIYHNLSKVEKTEFHTKMASFLEERYWENENIKLEELIYHLKSSEQMVKVLYYMVKDAKESMKTYSSGSTMRWEEAYEISKKVDSKYRLEILENLGETYWNKGENNEALKIYSELLHESTVLSKPRCVIIAEIQTGKIYLRKGSIDLSLKQVKKAIKLSKDIVWIEGLVQAKLLLNQILGHQGNIEEVEKNIIELLDFCLINKLEKKLGSIYNILGAVSYYNGNIEQAEEYYNKSILYFKKNGQN